MEQKIICGDNIEVLKTLADNSIDACVTDPPYGLGKEPNPVDILKSWLEDGDHDVKGGGFMGHDWDSFIPAPRVWREIFRVLKPGGHVISFFGTRTYDWGVMAMRLAGFEIRDRLQYCFDESEYRNAFIESLTNEQKEQLGQILKNSNPEFFWMQGQGFPKGLNIGVAIDEYFNAERKVVGKYVPPNGKEWNLKQAENQNEEHVGGAFTASGTRTLDITAPATDEAKKFAGFMTNLKPSNEPIVLARKPIEKGLTIVENVLKYSTGGMNIDGCRIESAISKGKYGDSEEQETHQTEGQRLGRFPSNVILSHSAECVYVGNKQVKGSNCKPSDIGKGRDGNNFTNGIYGEQESKVTISHTDEDGNETVEAWECVVDCPIRILDEQSGILKSGAMKKPYVYKNTGFSLGEPAGVTKQIHESSEGGASRFFYCAKASKSEREKGLEDFEAKSVAQDVEDGEQTKAIRKNVHPTVKPYKLISYLCRLITPSGGTVLDPFNGSGTTGIACKLEGFNYIGIEISPAYCKISEARIAAWEPEKEEQPVPDNQLNLF